MDEENKNNIVPIEAGLAGDGPAPLCAQGELFDDSQLPIRQDLVERVKKKSFLHTGAILEKDDELCRDVCIDLVMGVSRRLIAKKYRVSRNSVNAIREVMELRGELEPLKKEISRLLGRGIIMGLEEWIEAIASGKVNPAQLPIPICALIDKKALVDGEATSRAEVLTREVTPDAVQAAFEAIRRARSIPVDTLSTGLESATDSTPAT